MPSVVELSIWTGMGSCGCPIYLSVIHSGTAASQLMKVALHWKKMSIGRELSNALLMRASLDVILEAVNLPYQPIR